MCSITSITERFRALERVGRVVAAVLCSWVAMTPVVAVAGQQLHGHVPAAVATRRSLDRPPVGQRLHLAIGLPARNPAELKRLIDELYDPASPNYRHYLTPAEFTAQFGPSEHDYQAVVDFAAANHLTVTATHPNRLVLEVVGAIADIEKSLHVTLRNYRHPHEDRAFYAPDSEPSLDLAVPVLSISGLDNYWIPRPNSKIRPLATANAAVAAPKAGSAPGGSFGGGDFRAAYVPGTTLTGAGQSVGLLQFDSYYANDIAAYKTQFGLPDVPLINVLVNGGVSTPGAGNGEVCLDIEMVLSMAPGVASIYVYQAPNLTSNFVPLLSRMANDNVAKQLSCSWGGGSANASAEVIFQQMASQGQSFFNATGDADALTGAIPFPSESPNITEVGATTLTTTGAGGGYVSEKVWNWGLVGTSYVGSSGGSSTYYSIPSWQASTSMAANQGSTSMRNIPDVAMVGDNIYVTYNNGSTGAFGGTSCAAPLWAGFAALINQQAVAAGRATVGFINPAIYAIGNSANYTNGFRDTTVGNNFSATSPTKFASAVGYDLCTGWGTPAGSSLINALMPPVLTVPFSEGFENSGGIPTGWSQEYGAGATSWIFRSGSLSSHPALAHGGSSNALLYSTYKASHVTKLVTPVINFGFNTLNPTLKFWMCMPLKYTIQDLLKVYYKTSLNDSWKLLASYSSSVTAWTQQTITLPNPGSSYYIAFEGNAKGGYGVCVDDVQVTGSFAKVAATVSLANLVTTYDGSPQFATATTMPIGLAVDLTYNGSSTAPTAAGSYAVVATINHLNYQGTTSGTLVIEKAMATVVLSALSQTYDGAAKPVSATTSPIDLMVDLTYDGSPVAPTAVGYYTVVATVLASNYFGSASATLVISSALMDLVTWRNQHFSAAEQSAGLSADLADPDGDGLSNLAEYALGLDPRGFSPPLVVTRDASGLSITFTRPANLLDVSYGAESSDDLTHWSPIPLEILLSGPTETVRARDPLTTGDPFRRMLRLRFERP